MKQAVARLRDRLRDSAGLTATIIDENDCVLVLQQTIVQVDMIRAVRDESDFQISDDDAAFLVGADILQRDPEIGWLISVVREDTAETVEYRVTERPELQTCWRWHDREEQTRVVFTKEFKRS